MPASVPVPVLWITGLAGSGKTTLARGVAERLRAAGHQPLLLDGDEVTQALEGDAQAHPVSYEAQLRMHRAWRIARLAALAARQAVPPIVATVSLFHAVQRWNRAQAAPLVEVLLKAPMEMLAEHRPHLYGGPVRAGAQHVVGLDIPAQYPERPELVLLQGFHRADLAGHVERCVDLWKAATGAGQRP